LKKIPEQRRKDKPVRLPLPHPIYSAAETEVCLIVKDHAGEGHKAAKAAVRAGAAPGVAAVVGLSKLKTKYESHEAKRKLAASYDLFAADDRVLPSLPKLLGKAFFKNKKQPVPVRLAGRDWGAAVAKALGGTYLFWGGGSSLTVRVARASQGGAAGAANALAAAAAAVDKCPSKWAGVKAVYLKTAESVALPVWQAAAGAAGAAAAPAAVAALVAAPAAAKVPAAKPAAKAAAKPAKVAKAAKVVKAAKKSKA
jgi:ribosome biogenesis protein UTP30